MLMRISLIVALIAALAAGTLSVLQVKDKITTLVQQRDDERSQKKTAQDNYNKAQRDLTKAKNDLTQTQQELTDTKTERDKAVASEAAQKKRADELSDKLTKTTQERDDAQTKLAQYEATGVRPEEVGKLSHALKDTQEALEVANQEKIVIQRVADLYKARWEALVGPVTVVTMRADLRGKILVVDPKWDFVVLNIGQDQGVVENGELLVSRDGKLVSKVIVRSVEKDRSIANIMSGWKIGEVFEGDVVTPAHPAT
jgi:vacuolar-type H+-ATPase subunit I/STV1